MRREIKTEESMEAKMKGGRSHSPAHPGGIDIIQERPVSWNSKKGDGGGKKWNKEEDNVASDVLDNT